MGGILKYIILAGLGGCAIWYVAAFRRWARRMRDPMIEKMSDRQRSEFMQSDEYLRLRNGVRQPMWVTTALVGLLLLVLKIFN